MDMAASTLTVPDIDAVSSPDSNAIADVCSTHRAEGVAVSLKDIARIAGSVNNRLADALQEISSINFQTRLLSFNAQLEASRAGDAGRAFDVVAREMVALSDRTGCAARRLEGDTNADLSDLAGRIEAVGSEVRGVRLSDLAFTNLDLIDRNLYERSCDVRWWATDSSCVQALADPAGLASKASQRLGVILDAYTVYFDIVLCDRAGKVIANGRPGKFKSEGTNQASTPWFRSAMGTRNGGEFGFAGLHRSPTLADNQMVLVYSAAVRADGLSAGEIIGCLGIVFNWEALAQTIVLRTQLGEAELKHTRVCIVDGQGGVIADNRLRHLSSRVQLSQFRKLIECRKGYHLTEFEGTASIVAYAFSPGFETYATGWHSFIIQDLVVD
jgi:Methyl-accepting chemotaxis protein (MCP) signalling domain/Cache domain